MNLEFIEQSENLTELKYEFKPTVKWLLSDLSRFIRWGTVSKEYFGKKREWFIQNILTDSAPADLERIDILALKGALKDIANEINSVIEKLLNADKVGIGSRLFASPELTGKNEMVAFKGRRPEDCEFKVGDIVLVDGENASPNYSAIIAALPPSPEFIASHPASYDEIDDSYLVLTGDGPFIKCHEHPHVSMVHPISIELPEEQVAALHRGLDRYLADKS